MSRNGARDKLRTYFLEHLGEVLDSETLRAAAGVSEWARRIRELRNEEGYQILTHNDRSDLNPGQYILEDAKPRPAFAREISKEVRAYVLDRNGFTCQIEHNALYSSTIGKNALFWCEKKIVFCLFPRARPCATMRATLTIMGMISAKPVGAVYLSAGISRRLFGDFAR